MLAKRQRREEEVVDIGLKHVETSGFRVKMPFDYVCVGTNVVYLSEMMLETNLDESWKDLERKPTVNECVMKR